MEQSALAGGTGDDRFRILLVEDDEANAVLASVILSNIGCLVHRVASGEDALNAWRRGSFDLVFMDYNLPGMSGPEVTSCIRQSQASAGDPDVAIVGLTAADGEAVRSAGLKAGMDEVMTKPFRVPEMKDLISRYVVRRGH